MNWFSPKAVKFPIGWCTSRAGSSYSSFVSRCKVANWVTVYFGMSTNKQFGNHDGLQLVIPYDSLLYDGSSFLRRYYHASLVCRPHAFCVDEKNCKIFGRHTSDPGIVNLADDLQLKQVSRGWMPRCVGSAKFSKSSPTSPTSPLLPFPFLFLSNQMPFWELFR